MIKLIMQLVFLIQASYVLNAEPYPHPTLNALTAGFACLAPTATVTLLVGNVLQVTAQCSTLYYTRRIGVREHKFLVHDC